jgi:hypothetical protein
MGISFSELRVAFFFKVGETIYFPSSTLKIEAGIFRQNFGTHLPEYTTSDLK